MGGAQLNSEGTQTEGFQGGGLPPPWPCPQMSGVRRPRRFTYLHSASGGAGGSQLLHEDLADDDLHRSKFGAGVDLETDLAGIAHSIVHIGDLPVVQPISCLTPRSTNPSRPARLSLPISRQTREESVCRRRGWSRLEPIGRRFVGPSGGSVAYADCIALRYMGLCKTPRWERGLFTRFWLKPVERDLETWL